MRPHLEVDHLGVKVALKLEAELGELIHAHARRMYARRKKVLAIGRQLQPVAGCWELQVLHQLDPPPAGRPDALRESLCFHEQTLMGAWLAEEAV